VISDAGLRDDTAASLFGTPRADSPTSAAVKRLGYPVSIVFILLTLAIFGLLPELRRDLHGKMVICVVLCQLAVYGSLFADTLGGYGGDDTSRMSARCVAKGKKDSKLLHDPCWFSSGIHLLLHPEQFLLDVRHVLQHHVQVQGFHHSASGRRSGALPLLRRVFLRPSLPLGHDRPHAGQDRLRPIGGGRWSAHRRRVELEAGIRRRVLLVHQLLVRLGHICLRPRQLGSGGQRGHVRLRRIQITERAPSSGRQ